MKQKQYKKSFKEKRDAVKALSKKRSFRVGLLVFTISMLVLDVFQTSVVSATGDEISALQQESRELGYQHERIVYDIAQHRSMLAVQERLTGMDFVAAGEREYILLSGNAVASR
ncbi:MAG: hypothetical protein HOE53_01345 [Candidatus Magasanikbacteria bacterium]|jgi:hypothetical protein|nr:hypothetical protein [Candidatus Magasanikbacteria bacterium]